MFNGGKRFLGIQRQFDFAAVIDRSAAFSRRIDHAEQGVKQIIAVIFIHNIVLIQILCYRFAEFGTIFNGSGFVFDYVIRLFNTEVSTIFLLNIMQKSVVGAVV